MNLVDTHAHLFWDDFQSDLESVIGRAADAGVKAILNLGTTLETSRRCVALAEKYDRCWAAAGFHPNDADLYESDADAGIEGINALTTHPKVVAIGETGLDFYRDRVSVQTQKSSLEAHFGLARQCGLPIVLHNREASTELRSALETWGDEITAILHCFTGDVEFGKWAIGQGHFLGLGGVFTYPSSSLPELVKEWNLDHLLLETDSPFLSPVPHRGRRNEPAYIVHTAEAVAGALGMSVDELAEHTSDNARRVLNLPEGRQVAESRPGA